jgi:dihydroorotase-like cyclic amidohydrolase
MSTRRHFMSQSAAAASVSEGSRRGMSYNHMAQVTSWNPARRYGPLFRPTA